jgi:hypothetical protein
MRGPIAGIQLLKGCNGVQKNAFKLDGNEGDVAGVVPTTGKAQLDGLDAA